jgi:hypothetical protein
LLLRTTVQKQLRETSQTFIQPYYNKGFIFSVIRKKGRGAFVCIYRTFKELNNERIADEPCAQIEWFTEEQIRREFPQLPYTCAQHLRTYDVLETSLLLVVINPNPTLAVYHIEPYAYVPVVDDVSETGKQRIFFSQCYTCAAGLSKKSLLQKPRCESCQCVVFCSHRCRIEAQHTKHAPIDPSLRATKFSCSGGQQMFLELCNRCEACMTEWKGACSLDVNIEYDPIRSLQDVLRYTKLEYKARCEKVHREGGSSVSALPHSTVRTFDRAYFDDLLTRLDKKPSRRGKRGQHRLDDPNADDDYVDEEDVGADDEGYSTCDTDEPDEDEESPPTLPRSSHLDRRTPPVNEEDADTHGSLFCDVKLQRAVSDVPSSTLHVSHVNVLPSAPGRALSDSNLFRQATRTHTVVLPSKTDDSLGLDLNRLNLNTLINHMHGKETRLDVLIDQCAARESRGRLRSSEVASRSRSCASKKSVSTTSGRARAPKRKTERSKSTNSKRSKTGMRVPGGNQHVPDPCNQVEMAKYILHAALDEIAAHIQMLHERMQNELRPLQGFQGPLSMTVSDTSLFASNLSWLQARHHAYTTMLYQTRLFQL